MVNQIRGDDDVLALLNEMTGSGPPSSPSNVSRQHQRPQHDGRDDGAAAVAAPSRTGDRPSSVAATTLAAAHRLGSPSDPRVEIVRHRVHEKFKAGFYDLFRSCSSNGQHDRARADGDADPAGSDRNRAIRSTIHSVWKSMPPHSVWERFQFSLKTLEGECVREAIRSNENIDDGSGLERYTPPWCRHDDVEQLLQQLICPTVHQIHSWTVAGRREGTLFEPLLPVPFISSFSNDATSELQQINRRYRRGTSELLQEEVKFQFRRTFKQQRNVGGNNKNGVPLSTKELFESFRDLDEAAGSTDSLTSNERNTKMKRKKSKDGKKKSRNGSRDDEGNPNDEDTANNEDESIDEENYVLRTIFQSRQFERMIQKLHKKFQYLAEETHSSFMSELQKCSNRTIAEEQSRSSDGGRGRRRNKNGGGVGRGLPKIAPVHRDRGGEGGAVGIDDADDREEQVAATFAGVSLRINETHRSKLHSLYRRTLRDLLGRSDDSYERYLAQFPRLLFSILLRYDALEGAGLQSAVPPTVFRYLRERFGCRLECFASPFNCWSGGEGSSDDDGEGAGGGGIYGSAFGDTDAAFGSVGSFFDIDFLAVARRSGGGCFQANPPFASEFIERMCRRIHRFLGGDADGEEGGIPLMFVVFVPSWSESPGWKALSSSPCLTRHVSLSQKDDVHYYAEGTQHRRWTGGGGKHRVASFDTSVFFLQNDAARERWPLSDGVDEGALKRAFAMTPPDGEVGKGDARGAGGARARKIKPEVTRPQERRGQNHSIAEAKRKKKRDRSEDKAGGTPKKKKMVSGPTDEMSILASMGMFDEETSGGGDRPNVAGEKKSNSTVRERSAGSRKKKNKRRRNEHS